MTAAPNIHEVIFLLQHRRVREAEQAARKVLSVNPNDPRAHSLLALSLTAQSKANEAITEARQGIGLAPNLSYGHYVLAMVLYHADKNQEALKAIGEAIRLDPEDTSNFEMQGKIFLDMEDWNHALEAARQGLKLDPQNVDCANLEAMALVHLGRQGEASVVIEDALRRDPENPTTHANLGWADLHAGRHQDALIHFREALRLKPENEWARRGIIEAMKARNLLYRPILSYFLWISRMSGQVRYGLFAGLYVLFRVLRIASRANPDLNAIVLPIAGIYLLIVLMTWIANPLFNLFLRLDKFGRMALTEDEIRASNWIGVCVFGGIGLLILGIISAVSPLTLAGVGLFAMSIPVAGLFRGRTRKSRVILTVYAIALVVVGVLAVGLGLVSTELGTVFGVVFLLGWILYTWIANLIINL